MACQFCGFIGLIFRGNVEYFAHAGHFLARVRAQVKGVIMYLKRALRCIADGFERGDSVSRDDDDRGRARDGRR